MRYLRYLNKAVELHAIFYFRVVYSRKQNAWQGEGEDTGGPEPTGHGPVIGHHRRFRRGELIFCPSEWY